MNFTYITNTSCHLFAIICYNPLSVAVSKLHISIQDTNIDEYL